MEGFERRATQHTENKELKEKPPIELSFYFAPHVTAEDYKNIGEKLKGVDVVYIENLAWEPDSRGLQHAQAIASGEESFTGEIIDDTDQLLSKLSGGDKIQLEMIDLPAGHELIAEHARIKELGIKASNALYNGDISEAYEKQKEYLEAYASFNSKREAYIQEQLRTKVDGVYEDHPELAQKESSKVMVVLGPLHTEVAHNMRKNGYEVKSELGRHTIMFQLEDELIRKIQFGEISDLDADDLKESILLSLLEDRIRHEITHSLLDSGSSIADSNLIAASTRYILQKFEISDFKDMSDQAKKNQHTINRYVYEKFDEKGIELPTTEEELKQMALNVIKHKKGLEA